MVTPIKYGLNGSSAESCPIQAPDTPRLISANGTMQQDDARMAPSTLPVASKLRRLSLPVVFCVNSVKTA